jgi:hypothetical protein
MAEMASLFQRRQPMALSPQVTKDLSKRAHEVVYDAMQRVLSLASEDKTAQAHIALAGASGAVGIAAAHLLLAANVAPSAEAMIGSSLEILNYIRSSLEMHGDEVMADLIKDRPELAGMFECAAARS